MLRQETRWKVKLYTDDRQKKRRKGFIDKKMRILSKIATIQSIEDNQTYLKTIDSVSSLDNVLSLNETQISTSHAYVLMKIKL